MTRPHLRVRWAGPAVLLALLATAAAPRTTTAAATAATAHASSTAGATVVAVPCAAEALAFVNAWIGYIHAWEDYINSLPGGTEPEIMDSANRLEQAANKVGTAGMDLIRCLAGYSGYGPIIF
jgi:hypothetical protein